MFRAEFPTLVLAEFQSLPALDFGTVRAGSAATVQFAVSHPGILPIDLAFITPHTDESITLTWHPMHGTDAEPWFEFIKCRPAR